MQLQEIEKRLSQYDSSDHVYELTVIGDELKRLKREAVNAGDQALSKHIWCLETIQEIQTDFVNAYHLLKKGKYYDAWCKFERIEINFIFLERHFDTTTEQYSLDFIRRISSQFQSLFPYKLFLSPEMLIHECCCSICHQPISIRHPCEHKTGEIYDGQVRSVVISNFEFLGMAIVKSPVQKYSVLFLDGQDTYGYSSVDFVIKRLTSPFSDWTLQWTTKRQPHNLFRDVGRNGKCPCGSGKKYKKCCLQEIGVIRPHCLVEFELP